jgi:hypothetical protein
MKETARPTNRTAGRVIDRHFARYRGKWNIAADIGELAAASEWLRWCLHESELIGLEERGRFFLAVTEDLWPEGYGEDEFGDTAFELLVQFARYYGAYRVTPRVLAFVRQHSMALETDPIELLDLAKAVTDECRQRYRPHLGPLSKPAEILAPALRRDEAIRVALRYWIARHGGEASSTPGVTEVLEREIMREPAESRGAKQQFLHDLREGLLLARPSGRKVRRADARRYRANASVALAAAIDEHRRSGLGFDGVVAERARRLASFLGTTPRRAFGYLYYLARHSR